MNDSEFSLTSSSNDKLVYTRVRKRIPLIQKSLGIALVALQGMEVILEMKDDTEISGTVVDKIVSSQK
jgi:hypothetical protein